VQDRVWVGILLALVFAFVGCRRGPQPLAEIADHDVMPADLERFVAEQTGKAVAESAPDLVAALFQDFLEEEVLLAASPNPADRTLRGPKRSARTRELLATVCPPPAPPSRDAVEARAARSASARTSDRLLLRQLILPDETTARVARDRARRREDFPTLSRELSRAANAAEGGMIGWVARGQLPPEFEAAVFGLGPGEVGEPVATNAGWHVFQVMERESPGTPTEVDRQRAHAEISAEIAEESRRACLVSLAARVGVTVHCETAPFPCRNPFAEAP